MTELLSPPTFDSIVDPRNIKSAYLDVVLKFDADLKSNRYRGVDGIKISTLDFISEKVLEEIRGEMIAIKKICPAYITKIPKKNGKKRKIYVYSVRERIKAEAIYRMLLPFFDAYFSPFLFSYRSSHPTYYAARSTVRRYKRYYGQDHVLVTDISDYAETIDHEFLFIKLNKLGLDPKIIELLNLFITNDVLEDGQLKKRSCGVLTGTPLYALLSNLYMDDFDKWAGKYVSFYRRVGDDIIAMDKDKEKIVTVSANLAQLTKELKLKLNNDKAKLIPNTEEFKFLGYSFKAGKIGFDDSSRKKVIAQWTRLIHSGRAKTDNGKIKYVKNLVKYGSNSIQNQHTQLIDLKILVDDTEQIRDFSEHFFKILTVYFRNSYSAHKRRSVEHLMRKTKAPSLFSYYIHARYPKKHEKK